MFDSMYLAALLQRPTAQEIRPAPPLAIPYGQVAHYAKSQDSGSPYEPVYIKKLMEDQQRSFFDARIDRWLSNTRWQSSMFAITADPMFEEIKRMGDTAVKFILERIRSGDVKLHWFPVLYDLSGGHDPVPIEEHGVVPKMAIAWIKWGEDTRRI
jgi:hypothetical protein